MKETWDKTVAAPTEICSRAEDLVAYLYGEASVAEARDFEQHTADCPSCRTELAAFGNLREAIGDWRQEALGAIASPALDARASSLRASEVAVSPRGRSAFAALREFFTLSPIWMRAATAAAALLFCALAAIAVAYFVQQPRTVIVEKPGRAGYSEEELHAKIDEAIRKQNNEKVKEEAVASPSEEGMAGSQKRVGGSRPPRNIPQVAANNARHQLMPRKATVPSAELVRADDYLPFTASKDEERLPSLTDLVNEDN
ncbi:MAG TPA: zf-HC2 domain-containing protein [Pyrinomonadaceae bacterium]|nr:zf-HC2 domain-containing protein [Pyrinomonadaceae bacterium]